MLRIKSTRDERFVSVSTDALQKAYIVSPTFAQLKPHFEGELGRNWQVPTTATLGVHEFGVSRGFGEGGAARREIYGLTLGGNMMQ